MFENFVKVVRKFLFLGYSVLHFSRHDFPSNMSLIVRLLRFDNVLIEVNKGNLVCLLFQNM